jgi:hypothetical protein
MKRFNGGLGGTAKLKSALFTPVWLSFVTQLAADNLLL